MLSGEGKENGEKTTIALIIAKKQLCTHSTLFFVHFFAVVLHDYNVKWKFQKIPSYTLCRTCSCVCLCVFVFFPVLPLTFTLLAASISYFLTATSKFSCCFSNKKCLRSFLSLALALCRSFPRWASLAWCLLSLFLCLSLSLYSEFVEMTINLSLILLTTRMKKQFQLSSVLTL